MFRNLSKVALLVLAALAALPAEAGDRRHDWRFPGHRSVFHDRFVLGERVNWRNRGIRFDNIYGRGHGRDQVRLLRHFSSPGTNRVVRSNLIFVAPGMRDAGYGGTYAGSSYAYQVDGGTYVGGNGYGFYPATRPEPLAPKAKVIDIAVQDDPCSYEANVCVIRP